MNNDERRKRNRIKTHQNVVLGFGDYDHENEAVHADMDTLSTGGISVVTSTLLNEDVRELTLRVPSAENGAIIEASIEKIWHWADPEGLAHRYGFLFTNMTSVDHRAIQAIVQKGLSEKGLISRRRGERRNRKVPDKVENKRSSDRRWTMPTWMLYINGRDVDTHKYEYYPYLDKAIVDPKGTAEIMTRLKAGDTPSNANEYIYGRSCVGTDVHNEAALKSAHEAFKTFSSFPLTKRMKIFEDIHRLLLQNKETLLQLLIAEGHPRKLGEWEFSGMLQAFTSETVSFYKSEVAKNRNTKNSELNLLIRKPDGVVCVSPPRNAASSNSLTGALSILGGNVIVLKPPLTLPVSTMFLWRSVVDEALRANGAPRGTLNIVTGNTASFINQWIQSPFVNDIVYFGESNRGLEIGNRIYAAGKKPVLELSGKDILIVWDDADIEAASDSLVDCFLGSTQICMVPKMALIHEGVYEKFEEVLIEKVSKLTVGLPSDPDTYLSPVSKISTFFSFLQDALANGGKIVFGGRQLNYKGQLDEKGIYLEPTLVRLDDSLHLSEMRCVQEETFFPLLPLVKISGKNKSRNPKIRKDDLIFEEMLSMVQNNKYGLRVSAWSRSDSTIRRLIRGIHNCGLLRINCRHVDFSTYLATHGGPGKTGGPFGELNYFWQKTTHLQGISVRSYSK